MYIEYLVAVGGILSWGGVCVDLWTRVPAFANRPRLAMPIVLCILSCLAAILLVLQYAAAPSIRADSATLVEYEILGIAWLGLSIRLLSLLGLSVRDDVIERGNRGALWAIAGGMIGITACFAGSSMGSAELILVLLASLQWVLVLLLANKLGGRWIDAITIDRDEGAGLRFGALMAAIGLGIGSAMAGDWISTVAALQDSYARLWTLAPTFVLAILVERSLRNTREKVHSLPLAAAYLLITIAVIAFERHLR